MMKTAEIKKIARRNQNRIIQTPRSTKSSFISFHKPQFLSRPYAPNPILWNVWDESAAFPAGLTRAHYPVQSAALTALRRHHPYRAISFYYRTIGPFKQER